PSVVILERSGGEFKEVPFSADVAALLPRTSHRRELKRAVGRRSPEYSRTCRSRPFPAEEIGSIENT
ncbi:hypothetical protein, partial [Natronococcus amylolyticus]|uniref:hypothetical protein n=1 Tax=Natronococcus amylolyticus TaxID=44470 RepID=UPI0019D39509